MVNEYSLEEAILVVTVEYDGETISVEDLKKGIEEILDKSDGIISYSIKEAKPT